MAKVAACSSCTTASTGNAAVKASTVQRTRQALAAIAVSRAGPSRATQRPPQTNSTISITMPSAMSSPIAVSLSPAARQWMAAKP